RHFPLVTTLACPYCSFHLSLSFFSSYAAHRYLHSFPTRRSSDLVGRERGWRRRQVALLAGVRPDERAAGRARARRPVGPHHRGTDRKSTRLNSSHVKISYAVFCLKKKKQKEKNRTYVCSITLHRD